MLPLARVASALIAASFLAACSGGNIGSSAVPSQDLPTFVATGPNTAAGDAGRPIQFMSVAHDPITGTPSTGGRGVDIGVRVAGLLYHNGLIQASPKLYVVFWGPAWSGAGDPQGMAARYISFLQHVGGSTWNATVTQYTMTGGVHIGNTAGNFGGSYIDVTSSPPASPSQAAMAAEAAKAATHFGDLSAGAQYIVAMPHGIVPSGFRTQYCAYHSATVASGKVISWTNMPYLPDAGSGCGAGFVTGSVLDGVSIVGGHEMAEAETDPQLNAWYDGNGQEIGDKCAWTNLQNTNLNGTNYPTQPLWSNAVNKCVQ